MKIPTSTAQCLACGAQITRRTEGSGKRRDYCGGACTSRAYRLRTFGPITKRPHTTVCVCCDQTFTYYINRKVRKFCSRRCLNRFRGNENNRIARDLVFQAYSDYCACCGEQEKMFLSVDHMKNDGAAHRRGLKGSGSARVIYEWLRKNNFPAGFQVLCRNCNWGKHVNKGVCPHQSPVAAINPR